MDSRVPGYPLPALSKSMTWPPNPDPSLRKVSFFGDDEVLTWSLRQFDTMFFFLTGDVIVLENHLVMHARMSFTGERKILAALLTHAS